MIRPSSDVFESMSGSKVPMMNNAIQMVIYSRGWLNSGCTSLKSSFSVPGGISLFFDSPRSIGDNGVPAVPLKAPSNVALQKKKPVARNVPTLAFAIK